MKGLFRAITAALLFVSASPALAWWDLGHMTIAVSAYKKLDPAVRAKVDHLMTLNPAYGRWTEGVADADKGLAAFSRASVWADDIKRDPAYTRDDIAKDTAGRNIGYDDKFVHDYWHYIDIPFTTDETPVRMPDAPNALTQLRLFTEALSSTASEGVKSYDLVWMLHIVGDLHQPLHATARFSKELDDDRGGNDEEVIPIGAEKVRLHLYWDALLGTDGTPEKAVVAADALPAPDALKAKVSDPALWLIESFALAQNEVYTPVIGGGIGPYRLDQAYEDRARSVAKSQAALAGARLALVINTALR
ncbi:MULTISPECIES: S1/P1 nuclease [unclassified Neorhizobium]|uniref:S1/P1 nuclease n=1 Tax=unclassified Neorhizobium TaxID=2629175 RepID=UPI001FF1F0F7|nr:MULTISPECIES: S1/P1 nuclease [unclassified Neorhizobium]MCJ9668974.1 S1/P1 nuclease [Neorhizobium sp. SHOUNA12B]MCJ9744928.1 S1/P1 nuclease [Neorhizobium sp. SHOUNA12A]